MVHPSFAVRVTLIVPVQVAKLTPGLSTILSAASQVPPVTTGVWNSVLPPFAGVASALCAPGDVISQYCNPVTGSMQGFPLPRKFPQPFQLALKSMEG